MKIKFVHQYFYPETAGAAVRLTELAAGLHQQGFEVSVLTSTPKSGRIPPKETYQGVSIERISKICFDKNNNFGRIFNALYFFITALFKLSTAPKDSILLIGSDPPFLSFLGWVAYHLRKQKYVLLVLDIYPELAVQFGYLRTNSWVVRLWTWLDRLAFSHASAIVTPGKYMKETLVKKLQNQESSAKIWTIPTWEDGETIRPLDKNENWFAKEHHLTDRTVVLYSGNMGLAHELTNMIIVAEALQHDPDIFFLFIGEGGQKNKLIELAAKKNLKNISFLPYQPPEVIPYSCTCGDIALISLKPEAKGLCIPTKFQTALASGQAILAVVPKETEIADLLENEPCGIQADPDFPQQIVQAILKFHRDPAFLASCQKKAREVFESKFTKRQVIKMYAVLFQMAFNGKMTNADESHDWLENPVPSQFV